MTTEWDEPGEAPARNRRWLWVLLLVLLIFASGAAAAVYTLRRFEPVRTLLGVTAPARAPILVRAAPAQAAAALAPGVPQPPSPETARRLARVEQDLARINARAVETSSNADRAEGLLVAFAARRALDRGTTLGYMEGLLRDRFGATQPQAVATILSAAHQPVTLEDLRQGFEEVAPKLVTADPRESWWTGVRRELTGLIVVRRATTPSAAPADRLQRARRQLEAGHVDLALAEVARLPGRDVAADWILRARRYAAARSALDAIETAALLTPAAETTGATTPEPSITFPVPETPPSG